MKLIIIILFIFFSTLARAQSIKISPHGTILWFKVDSVEEYLPIFVVGGEVITKEPYEIKVDKVRKNIRIYNTKLKHVYMFHITPKKYEIVGLKNIKQILN